MPWKNSWFQIAFFAWLVSGALLVLDYVPGYILFRAALRDFSAENGMPNDVDAYPLLQKACQWRSARACEQLAVAYDNGIYGIAQDYQKAAALMQKLCDAGRPYDCDSLANLYLAGNGVAKDEQQADVLYQKACDLKYSESCASLAKNYENGYGVAKDINMARIYFQKACDLGTNYPGGPCEKLKQSPFQSQ